MDVRTLLETTLSGLGYELVDFELGHGGLMRVFIDAPAGIALDDCVKVSNHLTRLFTVENIDSDRLEVSSPGLDRPLTREADYVRFAGEKVRIKTRQLIGERKKFAGTLVGLTDGQVELDIDGERVAIPLASIDKARLDPQF